MVFGGDLNVGNCWLSEHALSPSSLAHAHTPSCLFDNKLKKNTETLNLTQIINTAAREQGSVNYLRDLAFVNQTDMIKDSGVAPTFSNLDHLPLLNTVSLQTIKESRNITIARWDCLKADIDDFVNALRDIDWNAITNADIVTRTTSNARPRGLVSSDERARPR